MNGKKARRSASDLVALIMRDIAADAVCANVAEVQVRSHGDHSQWEVRPVAKPGTSLSAQCWARLRQIQHQLRQQFDLSDA